MKRINRVHHVKWPQRVGIHSDPAAAQGRSQGHPGGGSAAPAAWGFRRAREAAPLLGKPCHDMPMASTDPGGVLEHQLDLSIRTRGPELVPRSVATSDRCERIQELGQFVAAAHVARILISRGFAAFMCDMTMKPPSGRRSPCANTTR